MAFSETPVEHAGESMPCHSWHVNSESTSAMSGLLCSAAWDQQVWELAHREMWHALNKPRGMQER